MNGLRLNWTCTKCGTEMHNDVGITTVYKVNGKDGFLRMKCDKCGYIHFVNSENKNIVVPFDEVDIEKSGTWCF